MSNNILYWSCHIDPLHVTSLATNHLVYVYGNFTPMLGGPCSFCLWQNVQRWRWQSNATASLIQHTGVKGVFAPPPRDFTFPIRLLTQPTPAPYKSFTHMLLLLFTPFPKSSVDLFVFQPSMCSIALSLSARLFLFPFTAVCTLCLYCTFFFDSLLASLTILNRNSWADRDKAIEHIEGWKTNKSRLDLGKGVKRSKTNCTFMDNTCTLIVHGVLGDGTLDRM